MLELYTFHVSHFSEKARWALDFAGIEYRERALLPGPHPLITRGLARRSHVPILKCGSNVVQGSADIVDYFCDHLAETETAAQLNGPDAGVREQERTLDFTLGRGIQRLFYAALLKDRRLVIDLWSHQGPIWARAMYTLAYPLVAGAVERLYSTRDAQKLAASGDLLISKVDELDRTLRNQQYLGGEQPCRLDITVAALLAPLCRPPQHRVPWPALPPELQPLTARLEGGLTWKHVLHMYRCYRTGQRANRETFSS